MSGPFVVTWNRARQEHDTEPSGKASRHLRRKALNTLFYNLRA
jgi:hypothetical protein